MSDFLPCIDMKVFEPWPEAIRQMERRNMVSECDHNRELERRDARSLRLERDEPEIKGEIREWIMRGDVIDILCLMERYMMSREEVIAVFCKVLEEVNKG